MKRQDYSTAITVNKTPEQVFNNITNVSKWWPEEVEGKTTELNDEFIFRSDDTHYSKNKIIEFVKDKKVVWLVTESIRKTDGFEWIGTKMIFEIIPKGNNTVLKFTYDGFIPEDEYDRLVKVCDMVIKEMLHDFITIGK